MKRMFALYPALYGRGERLRPVNRRAGDQSGPWRRHVRYAPTPTYDPSAIVAAPRVTR
jgi:hypothetical protein